MYSASKSATNLSRPERSSGLTCCVVLNFSKLIKYSDIFKTFVAPRCLKNDNRYIFHGYDSIKIKFYKILNM